MDDDGERKEDDDGNPTELGMPLANFADDLSAAPIPVTDGFRIVITTSEDWLEVLPEADSEGKINITIKATDTALNETYETISVTIDDVAPLASSAETGVGWDGDEEESGVLNGVKLVMDSVIEEDSVQATDFEIDSQVAASAVVGGVDDEEGMVIYLTAQSDFDSDARPDVEIVGEVTDKAGNEVDITSESASEVPDAEDGLAPTVTVTRDNLLLVAEEDEVTVTIESDESSDPRARSSR